MITAFYTCVVIIYMIVISLLNVVEDIRNFGVPKGSTTAGKLLKEFIRDLNPFQIILLTKNNKVYRNPEFPKNVLYMANHTSHCDALFLYGVLPIETKFLGSGYMWNTPLLGDIARFSKHIEVKFNGEKCTNRDELLNKTKLSIMDGNPVCVFPEGGIKRYKLKKGMFIFAKQHNIDIIPIRIDGCDNFKQKIVNIDVGDTVIIDNHDIDTLMTLVSDHIFFKDIKQ